MNILEGGVSVNREFSFTGLESLYEWLMGSEIGKEIAEMLCELPEAAAYLLIALAAVAVVVNMKSIFSSANMSSISS